MSDAPDEKSVSDLLISLQWGDQQAAFELHDRYAERLLHLIQNRLHPSFRRRMDPEDVVQSAFRSFFRIVSDTTGPDRSEAGKVWRLLSAVAINKLNAKYRFHLASKRSINQEVPHPITSPESIAADAIPEVETIFLDELERLMRNEIESHRRILEMLLRGQSEAAVAEANGCTIRTVYRVVERAVHQLRTRLSD